ncbi:hypothetical protein F4818DRAFT_312655 [Hypoxylon cercidicola]|nr:hypothetical protein F4818DRAFT_312655 [Hypoxylon cercidicola]
MDHFCITPRCSYCRFDSADSENITILRSDGRSIALPFSKLEHDNCTYEPCYPGCCHWDERLHGYHVDCIQHGDYQLPLRLFDATSYAYDPWPGENVRRLRWMLDRLTSMIYRSLNRLPFELCGIIARYCVREYALYISKRFCRDNSTSDFHIDLSQPVWAHYASLDGLAYIVSLTNKPTFDNAVPLPKPDVPVQIVYAAEDHLGVREVHFARSSDQVRDHPRPGLWWRTVRVLGPKLKGQTDGSKLRRLLCPVAEEALGDNVLWATPQPNPRQLRLTMIMSPSAPLRMASLELGQGVTGYSFCWHNYIVALKPHSDKDDFSYYKQVMLSHLHALWLYVPFRPHEQIVEIWQRRRKRGREVALIVVTSIDGIYVMGAYPRPSWHPCSYELLYKGNPDEDSFFIDQSPAGIHAVASRPPARGTKARRIPVALSPYPESTPFEDFLYTAASVEDVAYVRLCRAESSSIITGLVFGYTDKHQESVGQIRLDRLEAHIMINTSRKMWLQVSRSTYGFPQVVDMGFSPTSKSNRGYIYITWHGFLEWWFSLNQCKLYYNGQASHSTRR